MTIVTAIWSQTISVPYGGCHILLLIFTLGVINVVRSCPIDQIDVSCFLTLYVSLYHDLVIEGKRLGRLCASPIYRAKYRQIHNTKKNYSLKSNKNWNEQLQFTQSILPLRLFGPFWTDGKCTGFQMEWCGFQRCQSSFYWVLGKGPIFHRELLMVVLSLYLFICLFDYNLRTRIQLSAWWRGCRLQGSSLWVRQQSGRMFR